MGACREFAVLRKLGGPGLSVYTIVGHGYFSQLCKTQDSGQDSGFSRVEGGVRCSKLFGEGRGRMVVW